MKKGLIFLATLMLGTTIAPVSNSYHKIGNVPTKRLSNDQNEEENLAQYLATEASRNSAEQQQVEARIASFVSRSTSTTNEEEALKYDMFFNYGSEGFWANIAVIYLPSVAMDFIDYAECAMYYAEQYYGRNLSDDASDAFRHVYLIAMITVNHGRTLAQDFYSLLAGYTGPDMAQQNRHTMDCHNNAIGVEIGQRYIDSNYAYSLGNNTALNIAKFTTHAVKYGSHYDIYEMTADDMGFIHTREGRGHSLFPPYC